MVSLVIGLVILAAIGAVYVNTTNLMKQREDQADLNEPARVILRLLRQDVMRAGYIDILDATAGGSKVGALLFDPKDDALANMYVRDTEGSTVTVPAPISKIYPGLTPVFGCAGAMLNKPKTIVDTVPPSVTPKCDTAGTSATKQSLRIAYQGVRITGAAVDSSSLGEKNTDTGAGLDCLQQSTSTGPLVINDYFLRTTNGVSQFACRGSGSDTEQDLAAGVEEFVVRYQMAKESADGNAAGGEQSAYLDATDVSSSAQKWSGVTAVEVCIVSATDQANRGAAAVGTTDLQPKRPTCERATTGAFKSDIARASGDKRLWKRFTSVISVRNAVFASPI